MSAVWAWIRLDLRARARSLTVLAVLVAVTAGVVLTSVAGARRGASTIDRLVDRTLPATVAALPNQPDFDWEAVEALPEVAALARFAVASYQIDGVDAEESGDFPYADGIMDDVERPVVLEGRVADPTRDDEAVITRAFEGTYGKGVGDTVTIRLYTPDQADQLFSTDPVGDPGGPVIEARIVGVVRSPWFSDSGTSLRGRLIPSAALFDQHLPNLIGANETASINALVRLHGGAGAVAEFRDDLAEVSGRRDIDFFNLAEEAQHQVDVADFEADALLAFAASALVAAIFLVGQSVVRFVAGTTQDLRVLSAVGMPPRHVRVAAAAGPTLAAVVGAAVGVIGAYGASSRFPMGTVAPFEPEPGRDADLLVLIGGLIAFPVLVAGGAVLASWRASRASAIEGARPRSVITGLATRLGLPVPVAVGARFAMERGRGAQAVPVIPAIAGAVLGVLGVVAALTFADGVDDASNPERFGQVAELQAFLGFNGEDFVPVDDLLPLIDADPDVVTVNDSRQGVVEAGRVDVPLYALDPTSEPHPIVVTEGRAPVRDDEVAIAPQTADDLGVGVGDTVELAGSRSTGTYVVTGISFVPEGSHNGYDSGAWAPADTYDDLVDGFKFHTADVVLRDGSDPDEVIARLATTVGEAVGEPPEAVAEVFAPPFPPSRLSELRQVERLPVFLAGFLALLAVAAVGHALATAVRRRRHDLAVLRAVGVTRWQSRVTVITQATLLAVFGIAIGVPLGFALGRTLWRSVADSTPVEYVPPFAVWALILVAPVALLAANLLAAWPSHRAASMRVAHVLRTE